MFVPSRQSVLIYMRAFAKHPVDTVRSINARIYSSNPNEKLPLMCWDAIDFIRSVVHPGMNVFEYGSGGSTIFLAELGARLVSVEHDLYWYKKVNERLAALNLDSVDYRFVSPDPIVSPVDREQEVYTTALDTYSDMDFRTYVEVINEYPDSHFDLLIVDGRSRVKCICNGVRKVRGGGYLVLDNS